MTSTSVPHAVPTTLPKPYRGERRAPWLMLAPALTVLGILAIAPTAYLVYMAFHRKNLFQATPPEWVGTENFSYLFSQRDFVDSIVKTFTLAGGALAAELVLGFLFAALIFRARNLPGMGVLRTVLTTPILLAPIVTAQIWRFMYQPQYGVINYLFGLVGLPQNDWLANPDLALWSVAFIDVWQWTPFVFLVVLAGMYGIPPSIYEAAELDGTSLWRQTIHLTIPMLKRVLMVVALLRLIDLLRVFDVIVGTTQGGPAGATWTLPIGIWQSAFREFSMGDAAAASLVLLVLVSIVITVFIRIAARPDRARA